MPEPEDKPEILRPRKIEDRRDEDIDAIAATPGHNFLVSRYPEGTFAEHGAEEISHRLINDILSDPHSFGVAGIKEALILLSRDFRDLGGVVAVEEIDFEEKDPATGISVGYRFSVQRSTYNETIITRADLTEQYLRPAPDQILNNELLSAVGEQGRAELPFLVNGTNGLVGDSEIFDRHSLRLGLYSRPYRCFMFTYQDDIITAENSPADTSEFHPRQVIFQHESPLGHHTPYAIAQVATLNLKEDGYGDRRFNLQQYDNSTFRVTRQGEDPGAIRIITQNK